jgi:multidrug efflux pump subunit AcrA (membrane-fusion protein)
VNARTSVFAAALLLACRTEHDGDAGPMPTAPPPADTADATAAAAQGMLGVVVPRREVRLATDQIARIRDITAVPGQKVEAGAKVVLLDDRASQSELRSALASVRAAEAEARRLALQAKHTATEVERAQRIAGFLSDDELRDLEHSRGSAVLGSKRAGADAAERRAQAEGIASRIAQAMLTSPFDGVVVERLADPGAVVAPGEPIVHIISEDTMVRFAAKEHELAALHVGAPVRVVFGDLGLTFDTTIEHVAPEIDSATRIVLVEAPLALDAAARERVRTGAIARVFPRSP